MTMSASEERTQLFREAVACLAQARSVLRMAALNYEPTQQGATELWRLAKTLEKYEVRVEQLGEAR